MSGGRGASEEKHPVERCLLLVQFLRAPLIGPETQQAHKVLSPTREYPRNHSRPIASWWTCARKFGYMGAQDAGLRGERQTMQLGRRRDDAGQKSRALLRICRCVKQNYKRGLSKKIDDDADTATAPHSTRSTSSCPPFPWLLHQFPFSSQI